MLTRSFVRHAVVLGLLGAVGPFAIDMYLPALPTIAADLGASTSTVQMTLMAFFVAFGLCQLGYGPISDMVGRRGPLLFGLVLFALASVGCMLAPSIEVLIGFRLLQGIGASAVMVIPRAVVRDLYSGIEATRMMALVMLVISIGPMLAPFFGSLVIIAFGWRAVFAVIGLVSILGIVLVLRILPETRPPDQRIPLRLADLRAGFGRLFRDPVFLALSGIGGLGMASFFAFLSASSFIYIEHFGLTPTQYSLGFSFNAIGFFATSQFAARLGARYGIPRVIRTAVAGYAVGAVSVLAVTLAGVDSLPVLMILLFLTFACLGLVVPTAMMLALEEHGPIAGLASALGGTLQMLLGALSIGMVSLAFDGTPRPMVLVIAAAAAGALVLTRLVPDAPAVSRHSA